jgi:hypothetical protein
MASADTLDYAPAAMRAKRTCCACGRIYDAESVQRDPGWEPTKNGWRCGACTRDRAHEVRARARELIAEGEPRWELATRMPPHGPIDECLQCEALLAAREMLLARGALTRAEQRKVAATVLANL